MFTRRIFHWVFCAVISLVTMAISPAEAAKRVALVIGASNYQNVPSLTNPANDAADVAAVLRRLDFEVDFKPNLDTNGLRLALQAFRQKTQGAEVAVIFYAGHGIAVDGVTRLVPVDARLSSEADVDFETVPLDLVTNALDGASTLRLAILDACRDNPFLTRMVPSSGRKRNISRGLAPVEPRRGDTLVWYAARDGATASDGTGRNSPFTEALLSHIEQPGLEIDRLFRVVRDSVVTKTGIQEPFVYGSRGAKDFYFRTASVRPTIAQPGGATIQPPTVVPAYDTAKLAYDDAKQRGTKAALEDVAALFPDSYWGRVAKRDAEAMNGSQTAMVEPPATEPTPERVLPEPTQPEQPEVAPVPEVTAPAPAPTPASANGIVVDPSGGGDHLSIRAALNAAPAGATILVRPGRYAEYLDIQKSITIKGDGPREQIILEASGAHVIRWSTGQGSISGMTMRHSGGAQWVAVDIRGGSLTLENNDLTSNSPAVVMVHSGATPTIRGNRIHDSKAIGIVVTGNGSAGRIEDNEIFGTAQSGIEINNGGAPTVTGNRISKSGSAGIYVYNGGNGRIENNEIFENTGDGILISTKANPTVIGNTVRNGQVGGINIFQGGKGTIQNNTVTDNARAGIFIASGGAPTVTGNTATRNQYFGIWIHKGGLGTITGNTLTGNTAGGLQVLETGTAVVVKNNKTE